VDTKFDKFTELQDILVELVIVDDWEDCLIESLQLFHIVTCHITKLYYAAATSITYSSLNFSNDRISDSHHHHNFSSRWQSLFLSKFTHKPDMPRL